jgi:hypothetical protein
VVLPTCAAASPASSFYSNAILVSPATGNRYSRPTRPHDYVSTAQPSEPDSGAAQASVAVELISDISDFRLSGTKRQSGAF